MTSSAQNSNNSGVSQSILDNSNVTSRSSNVTNNYFGEDELKSNDRERLRSQLDRIEQKLDYLIQKISS